MKRTLVTIAAVLVIAAGAQGTITYTLTSVPAPNTPGSSCWTVQLHTDTGNYMVGFDTIIGDLAAPYTPMGQVWPPPSTPTVFADANWTFPFIGKAAQDDSQFPYDTTTANFSIMAQSESTTQLAADFWLNGTQNHPLAGQSFTLVQIVLANGTSIYGSGTVVEYDAQGYYSGTYWWQIPEPATLALLGLGAAGLLRRKR